MTKSAISNNLKVDQNFNLARDHKLRNYQGKWAPTNHFAWRDVFNLDVGLWSLRFESSKQVYGCHKNEFHHISNFKMPNLMILPDMAGKPLTVHLDTALITLRYRNSTSWTSSIMIFGFTLISLVATKLEGLYLVRLTEKDNYSCNNWNEELRGTMLINLLVRLFSQQL